MPSSAFWQKLVRGAEDIQASPAALALVMLTESGLQNIPSHVLKSDGSPAAVGINQFSTAGNPSTFDKYVSGLTPSQYLQLPIEDQLDYVIPYFRDVYNAHPEARKGGARDLYWLNFLPAFYVANAPDDYVITSDPQFVNPNRSLTLNGEDVIRAGGLKNALEGAMKRSPGTWNEALSNIAALGGSTDIYGEVPDALIAGFAPKFSLGFGITATVLAAVYAAQSRFAR